MPHSVIDAAPPPDRLLSDLRAATERACKAWGASPNDLPEPAFPAVLLRPLREALGLERAERAPGWQEREAALRRHYLSLMPRLRAEVLAGSPPPARALLDTPLDPDRLPRLRAIADAFAALLAEAGVPADPVFGAAGPWRRRWRDAWGQTCFAGCMPPLYGAPADLASYAAEVAGGASAHAVLDRRLTAPLLHEWAHLGRDRPAPLPPLLDECIAGYIGVHLHPAFAYPEPGDDNGIMGAAGFAQIGQAFAAAVGLPRLVAAQAGHLAWADALGAPLLRACQRLGWALHLRHRSPHLLPGAAEPAPWLALAWLRLAGDDLDGLDVMDLQEAGASAYRRAGPTPLDARMTLDALRALHLRVAQRGASWRVTADLPHAPITLDFEAGRASRPACSPLELAPPTYPLPPAVARAWREGRGQPAATLLLRQLDALPEAAHALLHAAPADTPGFSLR